MESLDAFARAKLAALEQRSLRRTLAETTRLEGPWVERDGRRLLSFCCNDYLNLSTHPAVVAAAVEATRRYGVGAGGSRLVTGNHPLYAALEARLARLKGTEDACVFGSGYLANTGIIPALAGKDDLLLVDELAHACIWTGARAVRRDHSALPAQRCGACGGPAGRRAGGHTACAGPDRNRVLDGWRPGPAGGAGGAGRASRCLADDG